MSTVYKVYEYDLIGKKLYTKEPMPHLYEGKDPHRGNRIMDRDTKREVEHNWRWEYTTTPPVSALDSTIEFLPYRADVTEDLPSSCRKMMTPKTYKNCVLMSETHGTYLQFYHEKSKTVLRIAINSNYYQPVK